MESQFTVLAVESESRERDKIERGLPEDQFRIQFAGDLAALRENLSNEKPDLVFLSMDMRSFEPLGVCERLSKAGIGVIMLCGALTRHIALESSKRGAIALLTKPLNPDLILPRTEKALQKLGKKLSVKEKLGLSFRPEAKPREKVELLIRETKELLALPFAVSETIRLCNDPTTDARDLERPIKSDPATAAMIMGRANSARYPGKTTSIQRAVVRIGLRETRNIVASFSVFKLFSAEDKNIGFNRKSFWIHSLGTGICAQIIASRLRHRYPEDAFMAGLLHDIGKIVLDDFLSEDYRNVVDDAQSEKAPLRLAEQSIFQAQHPYVGARVARHWGFPASIVEAISEHHSYKDLVNQSSLLSLGPVVCMANHMAKAFQVGSGGDAIAEVEGLALWDHLPEGFVWDGIAQEVLEELKEYMDSLNVPPEHFETENSPQIEGTAIIHAPRQPSYRTLLQLALDRIGLHSMFLTSIDRENIDKNKEVNLIISDLTLIDSEDERAQLKEKLAQLSPNNIVLSERDEKGHPRSVDFLWLVSKIRAALT